MPHNVHPMLGFSLCSIRDYLENIQEVICVPESGLEIAMLGGGRSITACSMSPAVLARTELIAVGLKELKQEGLETLLGWNKAGRRVFLYHQLRDRLSSYGQEFWDGHEHIIREGLLNDPDFSRIVQKLNLGRSNYRWKWLAPMLLQKWKEEFRIPLTPKTLQTAALEPPRSPLENCLDRHYCNVM